jgi:hypothetical protein
LLPLGKDATITTQQMAMDATPNAVWNVDTVALLAMRALVLLYHVETASVQALNCATTATQQAVMDAALPVLLRQDGNAPRLVLASVQRAFGSQETKCVETARHSGQKRILLISVMMATLPASMGARPRAQSSADTAVPEALRLLSPVVTQPAEMARSLATRYATTTTFLLGMDAVRAALKKLDGNAHTWHAVNQFAIQFVETGLSMEVNNATVLLGAAQHARPSADSPALTVHVRQSAEMARSLVTRYATTTTLLLGMDAVRAALKKLDGNAQHHHAVSVNRFAAQFVETHMSLEVKHATMATRETVMGAAQHAPSSADSTALTVHVRQSAETARSLATRYATTTTLLVGMGAVRTA